MDGAAALTTPTTGGTPGGGVAGDMRQGSSLTIQSVAAPGAPTSLPGEGARR
jgi:hypothetical protein